jgi:hypothetical protein
MYQTSDSIFAFSSLTLFACARDFELHTVGTWPSLGRTVTRSCAGLNGVELNSNDPGRLAPFQAHSANSSNSV